MFYALDAEYDKTPSEALAAFLSNANPFLFKDCVSADPAVYAEFVEEFDHAFGSTAETAAETYDFAIHYLNQQASSPALSFSESTDLASWSEAYGKIG